MSDILKYMIVPANINPTSKHLLESLTSFVNFVEGKVPKLRVSFQIGTTFAAGHSVIYLEVTALKLLHRDIGEFAIEGYAYLTKEDDTVFFGWMHGAFCTKDSTGWLTHDA